MLFGCLEGMEYSSGIRLFNSTCKGLKLFLDGGVRNGAFVMDEVKMNLLLDFFSGSIWVFYSQGNQDQDHLHLQPSAFFF
jgi:hypothetical protein